MPDQTKVKCVVSIEYTYNEEPILFEGTKILDEISKMKFIQDLKKLITDYEESRGSDDWIQIIEMN
jgi:hypothetical protein